MDQTETELRDEIIRLRPWHLEVEVTPGLTTRIALDAPAPEDETAQRIAFLDPRESWRELIEAIYPGGLAGRSFLDCACNCGGYVFWMKELGAGRCLGFDVREHWVRQAHFLERARAGPSDGVRFECADLYDLPTLDDADAFDITLFKGIFYHLPDPIGGLRIAAERTRELLIVDTVTRSGLPEGLLSVERESPTHQMSGVYGLNWFPTGPRVIEEILRWLGFAAFRQIYWRQQESAERPDRGRLEIVAARDEALFESYDAHSSASEPAPAPAAGS